MRAAVLDALDAGAEFRIADRARPIPGDREVRVRVSAVGVNPADLAIRRGLVPLVPEPRFPLVIGFDLAGVVDAVGPGAEDWGTGLDVVGFSPFLTTHNGTYAEEVVLRTDDLAPAPDGWDAAAAAALPSSGLTAVQALDATGAGVDDDLLVVGAGGSVGGLISQLAISRGTAVTVVVGPRDATRMRALGATDVVERGPDLAQRILAQHRGGFGSVVNTARDAGPSVVDAVRDGGTFVTIADQAPPSGGRFTTVEVVVDRDGAALRELTDLASIGLLSTRVATTIPFEQVNRAHDTVAAGGLAGKVVLRW